MNKFFLACILTSQISFAAIHHSNFEARHLDVIEAAIAQNCKVPTDVISQKSSQQEVVRVDQGIRDTYYTTLFEIRIRIDQNIFESQKIAVQSIRSDMYDHNAQDWGVYSVQSIQCSVE